MNRFKYGDIIQTELGWFYYRGDDVWRKLYAAGESPEIPEDKSSEVLAKLPFVPRGNITNRPYQISYEKN